MNCSRSLGSTRRLAGCIEGSLSKKRQPFNAQGAA
jgi:hypothetical protein